MALSKQNKIALGVTLGLLAAGAVGFVVWYFIIRDDDDEDNGGGNGGGPGNGGGGSEDCVSIPTSLTLGEPKTRFISRAFQTLYPATATGPIINECEEPLIYNWSISPSVAALTSVLEAKPQSLQIPAYTLAVGTYTLSVRVGALTDTLRKEDSLTLNVVKTALTAVIAGETAVTTNPGTALTFNGTQSTDPDVDPSLPNGLGSHHYTWTVLNSGTQAVVTTGTLPTFFLAGGTLAVGSYSVTLKFETPDRAHSASASVDVTVVEGAVPALSLVSNNEGPFQAETVVDLTVQVQPPATTWAYQWSVSPEPSWYDASAAFLKQARLQIPQDFNIPRTQLWTDGTLYTVSCTVSGPNPPGNTPVITQPATISKTFQTSIPGQVEGGEPLRHEVEVSSGVFVPRAADATDPAVRSLETRVRFQAGEWTTSNPPLEYRFYYGFPTNGDETPLHEYGSANTLTTSALPAGPAGADNFLTWGVRVRDAKGDSVTAESTVHVLPRT